MSDTTIKVDSAVRDRLAVLAAQRGTTIRDIVSEFAVSTLTQEELAARHTAVTAHLRAQLCPDLDDDDLADGERLWRTLETRRTPNKSQE